MCAGNSLVSMLVRGYCLLHWWHRVRDATSVLQGIYPGSLPIALDKKAPLVKTVLTCIQLFMIETALWTFVGTSGVKLRNNAIEKVTFPAYYKSGVYPGVYRVATLQNRQKIEAFEWKMNY